MATVTMHNAGANYRVVFNESPHNYDVAIVSTDSYGSPGPLNEFVLSEYGYPLETSEIINVEKGYYLLQERGLQPILFIDVIVTGNTETNLLENLAKALYTYNDILKSKKIWVPLMGTGSGKLSFIKSYETTITVIKRFPELYFHISLPDDKDGKQFVEEYEIQIDSINPKEEIYNEALSDKKIYLAGHIWGENDNQMDRFISEGVWQNGHDTKHTEEINSVERGDFIVLKSTFPSNGKSYLRLKAVGQVFYNPQDGHKLRVNWTLLTSNLDIEGLGSYRKTFAEVKPNHKQIIAQEITEVFPGNINNIFLPDGPSLYPSDLREYKIDPNGYLFYGQEVGEEIKEYDLIFLPKSSYGGIGNHSITSHVLNLLQIDKDTISFSAEDLLEARYAIRKVTSPKLRKDYTLIFIVTRDESKNHISFSEQLSTAINKFWESESLEKTVTYLKIFIPFLATGQAGMPINDSYLNLLPGLRQIWTTLDFEKIRINFPLDLDEGSVMSYNNLFLNGFISEPTNFENLNDKREEILEIAQDKIPFHLDQVVDEDKLGREPVAKAFVDLIKKDIFTDKLNYSFMVHLQGEWGAGKSSFLNFIKQNLNTGDEKWIIVEYNSWQNQHIKPPWWTLIDQVYVQSKHQLKGWDKFQLWRKEIWRRLWRYSGWEKTTTFFVFVVSLFFIMYFGQDIFELFKEASAVKGPNGPTEKSLSDTITNFLKLVITSTSVIATLYTLAKFITVPFFMNSSKEAESFVKKASDPMNKVKKHFSDLVDNINNKEKKRQLAIFIDDIDRCDKEFIVSLLEGIQTLFKEKRVLYIVAGDKNWITTSFGNMYLDFKPEDTNAKQLGEFFLEKAFQLSFRMPNISDEAKQNYWNSILGIKKEDKTESIDKLSKSDQNEIQNLLNDPKSDVTSPVFMKKMEKDFNLSEDSVSSLIIEEKNKNQDDLKHLLNDFHAFIDTNPRSIIRMANNYTMTRSTLIAERREFNEQKLFRWLVIEDLCPEIKSYINTASDIDSIKEKVNHMSNPIKQQNCLVLFDGIDDKDEQLTIEEIKIFKGL